MLVEEEFEQTWEGTEHERAESRWGALIPELEAPRRKVAGAKRSTRRVAVGEGRGQGQTREQAILTHRERTSKGPRRGRGDLQGRARRRPRSVASATEPRGATSSGQACVTRGTPLWERAPNLMLSAPEDRRQMAKFTPFDSAPGRRNEGTLVVGSRGRRGKEVLISVRAGAWGEVQGRAWGVAKQQFRTDRGAPHDMGCTQCCPSLQVLLQPLRGVFGKPPCADAWAKRSSHPRLHRHRQVWSPAGAATTPETTGAHHRWCTKRPTSSTSTGFPRRTRCRNAACSRRFTQFSLPRGPACPLLPPAGLEHAYTGYRG